MGSVAQRPAGAEFSVADAHLQIVCTDGGVLRVTDATLADEPLTAEAFAARFKQASVSLAS